MQVENSSAYTSLLYAQRAQTSQAAGNENTAKQAANSQETPSAEKTAAADTAKAAAVTGVTGSNLSKEVIDQLMKATQEADTSNTDTEKYDGPLSIGERHHLEDIANNPGYAEKQAKEIGIWGELVGVGKVLPTVNNGFSDADRAAFLAKQKTQMANAEQMQEKRAAYYENLKAQGLPPAKIYAKILEFNANLPESYDATLGWSEAGRTMSYSDYNNARLDYLQNLINQGKSATASAKPADSTKVAG